MGYPYHTLCFFYFSRCIHTSVVYVCLLVFFVFFSLLFFFPFVFFLLMKNTLVEVIHMDGTVRVFHVLLSTSTYSLRKMESLD